MKIVAITALVALLVSIPFVISRQKMAPVRIKNDNPDAPPDENRLYDNEDFMM